MTSPAHATGLLFEERFRAETGPTDLVRSTLPEGFLARLPVDPFDRPLFIDAEDVDAFSRDFELLLDCLLRLPDLLAADPAAMARLVGLPPDLIAAAVPHLRGMHRYGRADVYHDGTGLRLLEMGLSSAIGGAERAGQVPSLLLGRSPEFAAFAQSTGLRHLDPVDALLEVLGPDAAGSPLPMIEATGALAEEWGADWEFYAVRLREAGLDPVLCELGDLETTPDGLHWRGRPLTQGIRLFTALELAEEPRRDELAAGFLDLARRGSDVVLGLGHEIFNSKACLALLWADEVRDQLTLGEREALTRILPPGRLVGDDSLTYSAVPDGGREDWMLKATSRARGEGHVTGWTVDDETWARALEQAQDGGWMLQRRVVPRLEPGLATDDPDAPAGRQAVWGYFYGPSGYAGMAARLVAAGTSSIFGAEAVKWAPVFVVGGD